jgi:tryptophanyl-tRNA synthetase
MSKHVVADLAPIRERRATLESKPREVTAVLEHGNEQARSVAAATMTEVRSAIGLSGE